MRNRIHRHRCSRDVAVDATLHLRVETRRTVDEHRIERLGGAHIRVELQPDFRVVADVSDPFLADASDITRIHGKQFAVYFFFRDPRAYVVGDAREHPPHRIANHLDGFREADVPYGAGLHLLLELLPRQTRANLLLEWKAADPCILDPPDLDAIDALAHARQRNGQCVHDEAWIDAGAENGNLRFARHLIELLREPAVARRRVRKLLSRRNHRKTQLHQLLELRQYALERRRCAKDRDIRL